MTNKRVEARSTPWIYDLVVWINRFRLFILTSCNTTYSALQTVQTQYQTIQQSCSVWVCCFCFIPILHLLPFHSSFFPLQAPSPIPFLVSIFPFCLAWFIAYLLALSWNMMLFKQTHANKRRTPRCTWVSNSNCAVRCCLIWPSSNGCFSLVCICRATFEVTPPRR